MESSEVSRTSPIISGRSARSTVRHAGRPRVDRPHDLGLRRHTIVAITSGPTDKMKALVQDGGGSADVLHLRQIDKPAVTDDRVLVKVHAASVNAADYHMVHGMLIITMIAKLLRQSSSVRGLDLAGV